jgi:hypothetical protein
LPYAQRRLKKHNFEDWSQHIFALPGKKGAIYVDGFWAPALFVWNLPKLKQKGKEKVALLEKMDKNKDKKDHKSTQAQPITPSLSEVPLNIALPHGLSRHHVVPITGHAWDKVLNAQDHPSDPFQVLPCWVRLHSNGPYDNDQALLVSIDGDCATVYVVPRLPTACTERPPQQSYPARRFHPNIFTERFPRMVNIEISNDSKKAVMKFSDPNKELYRAEKACLLLGTVFTFYNGLLQQKVNKLECTSTWVSYDKLVSFGVFSFREVFPNPSPKRMTFCRILYIPWCQYQNIQSSNRVRYVDADSIHSVVVDSVWDGMAYVRHLANPAGNPIKVPLDLLRLNFEISGVVEIPPQKNTWLEVGSKPREALCALDGHCFTWSPDWIPALITAVGKYTLKVLVGRETQVIADLHTFKHYTDILQYTVHQRVC